MIAGQLSVSRLIRKPAARSRSVASALMVIPSRLFPFGDTVEREGGKAPWCYIYTKKLEEWIADKE